MIRRSPFLVAALAAVLAATGLSGCGRGQPGASVADAASAASAAAPAASSAVKFNGVDITGVEYAKDFHLPDPDGRTRSLADFAGRDVVVFFGYTHCPDACPTTLADLAAARKAMGPDGDRVQVVFITVDPERDSPALMKTYTAGFGPGVIGLRGDDAQTRAVAKDFKVFYAKVPGKTPADYTMDHTSGSYVFDPAGHVRLFIRNGATPEAIAEDLKALLPPAPQKT